ncbi:MAG: transposase [Xanthobacteraceae bacterium]
MARVLGVGVETADMLVNEVFSRHWRDRKAIARYAGLTGSPDESGRLRCTLLRGRGRRAHPRYRSHSRLPCQLAVSFPPHWRATLCKEPNQRTAFSKQRARHSL